MLNTGIYSLEQITNDSPLKNIFGADKRISVTLYEQILALPNAEQLAERLLLLFTDERGAYKRTYSQRFAEFDELAVNKIQKYFPQDAALRILDVGVSDARTAVDFFNHLKNLYPGLHYHASDYSPSVYSIEDGASKVTVSQAGKVIEIVWQPFVFNAVNPDRPWRQPFNRLIQLYVSTFVVPKILRQYKAGKLKHKEIFMFSPMALKLAATDARFVLSKHDILQPYTMQAEVIRAMNVLNTSYFSRAEFNRVLANIHAGLVENGILITGSNQNAGTEVHGGIYRKIGNGFKLFLRSGDGSQIEKMILDFKTTD